MERRKFVRLIVGSGSLFLGGCALLPPPSKVHEPGAPTLPISENEEIENTPEAAVTDLQETRSADKAAEKNSALAPEKLTDRRSRSAHFDETFPDDLIVTGAELELVRKLTAKFRDVQKHVGFGHFNLVGMDEFFAKAENSRGLTKEEKEYLEKLFHFDANKYGFTGARVFSDFTQTIDKNAVVKIPHSGHFLRKGLPLETYDKVKKDVGRSLILTSGIRGVAKQFHLFLEKTLESEGNLSKASRSLAPPGYSFHGRGDFDVGKIGYGVGNFTDDFAKTDEYKRLLDLGYVKIRYTQDNDLGVRFEPWHIKVES